MDLTTMAAGPEAGEADSMEGEREGAFGARIDPGEYRSFCLERLTELARLRASVHQETDAEAHLRRRLVDRALYAAYCDCREAGVEAEARNLLAAGQE